jgi:(1->4)-alpha-D-glucan 1-alpha-D-glucosylmutase
MRIPLASYRIQFEPRFGFRDGMAIIAYLKDLGISDLYASPIFRARPGSAHGYDVVDSRELNPDLGSAEDFAELAGMVRQEGMGWLQDIVPNHMAFDPRNPFLADVLENGPNSRYHKFFDIDWEHYYETIHGKVLIPFLARYYSEALENGEIRLGFGPEGFHVSYGSLHFPIRPESYPAIITDRIASLRQKLGEDHPDFIRFLGVLYILKTLQGESAEQERYDQIKFVKHTLAELFQRKDNKIIRQVFEQAQAFFNGIKGQPDSFNPLESLLAEQWFRLSFWKVASEEINYRRFFTINDLISLNICTREVFDETHGLILQLLEKGLISGLRVDHIDSIYQPAAYLEMLREGAGEDVYIVIEKILFAEEGLPHWPVQGTTGYDFLAAVNGVFCQTGTEKKFTEVYGGFTGMQEDYEALMLAKKRMIVEKHMFGDINNLAHHLKNLISRHRYGSDITMDSLKRALSEIMVSYPVYRTYLGPENGRETDFRYVRTAVDSARRENPALLHELNFIEKILLLQFQEHISEKERAEYLHFVMRFQQYTGSLMAKGFEDTLFYIYNRLLSLNEVGSQPGRFGTRLEEFHDFNRKRQKTWPHALNATATHDTKRGEDVRARLNVLSEIPREWARYIRSWKRLNRGHKGTLGRRKVPEANDEYFFYQTLVGVFPFTEKPPADFKPRIKDYLVKAVREAKVHTAWLNPDTAYEEAFLQFVDAVLATGEANPFWEEFLPFQRKIAWFGIFNALGQTLAKITSPGVPDFYQGTELWDLSLVDPDNRRPVDFALRKKALKRIRDREEIDPQGLCSELLQDPADGLVKMFLIHRALRQLGLAPDLFNQGEYRPLTIKGKHRDRVIAFERCLQDRRAVVVIPRFLAGLIEEGQQPLGEELWQDTRLELDAEKGGEWQNALTGATLTGERKWPLGQILTHFPVALLTNF